MCWWWMIVIGIQTDDQFVAFFPSLSQLGLKAILKSSHCSRRDIAQSSHLQYYILSKTLNSGKSCYLYTLSLSPHIPSCTQVSWISESSPRMRTQNISSLDKRNPRSLRSNFQEMLRCTLGLQQPKSRFGGLEVS